MRALALIAFLALQASIFTCGIHIHVDHLQTQTAPETVAQQDAGKMPLGHGLMDRNCQIHASHIFMEQEVFELGACTLPQRPIHSHQSLYLARSFHRIEHPPKTLHG